MAGTVSEGIVTCFGEILLRYSPSHDSEIRNASGMDVHVGGAEANVAVALSNLGKRTRMISALPSNELGLLARRTLQREGVDTFGIPETQGRMGVYYVTPAGPMRQSSVIYDREGSAFATFSAYDFEKALDGTRHLHISGISLAVSENSRASAISLTEKARSNGISISFDGNFRPALWSSQELNPRPIIAEMVSLADVMFGNHKDVSLLLEREFSGDGPDRRREAALAALRRFPNLSLIASTARQVDQSDTHSIVGRVDTLESDFQSAEMILPAVVDRIGTGDAFAAGVIDGWLDQPDDLPGALERGMGLTAPKHYTRGDMSIATRGELEAAISGKGDVTR